MIKKVTVRKNRVTVEFDKPGYDLFFRAGVQAFADAHFGGKRKVVVLPASPNYELPGGRSRWFDCLSGAKRFDCPKELADHLVGLAVEKAISDYVERLERYKDVRSWGRDKASLATQRKFLRNGFDQKPMIVGPEFLVHKAAKAGRPEAVCGVRRPRDASVRWADVTCGKCRKAALRGKP